MKKKTDKDEEVTLMVLGASQPRLWLGVICTAGLSFLLFWVVFAGRPAFIYQVGFLGAGALALWMADRLRRAGQDRFAEARPHGRRGGACHSDLAHAVLRRYVWRAALLRLWHQHEGRA